MKKTVSYVTVQPVNQTCANATHFSSEHYWLQPQYYHWLLFGVTGGLMYFIYLHHIHHLPFVGLLKALAPFALNSTAFQCFAVNNLSLCCEATQKIYHQFDQVFLQYTAHTVKDLLTITQVWAELCPSVLTCRHISPDIH